MQQLFRLASGLSSPAVLIVFVWCAVLIAVAAGPIDYPMQPSRTVLALVIAAISLFIVAQRTGAWCFAAWLSRQPVIEAPSNRSLRIVVVVTSLAGITGIGLMALDRMVLSDTSTGGYAQLLRCAPQLVDIIEVKRTPLLYAGYAMFSFGFASLLLFLVNGDEIRGWPAVLAQLSIVSPIGYALLYSGRMPILLIIVLIISAMMVRLRQGMRAFPSKHHLALKMAAVFVAFVAYSSVLWSTRQSFCQQMSGVVRELQLRMDQREVERGASGEDLSRMVEEARKTPRSFAASAEVRGLLEMLDQSWNVRPRYYVVSAMESGFLPPSAAFGILGPYFYLTHGIRVLDRAWRARDQFSPQWGVYEVGILSPMLRIFFPGSERLAGMDTQLKAAKIYGFFSTAWAAAFIDFGLPGAIIYILIWGFVAGWSAFGARHSPLATPSLLLVFCLASIFLSPIQGPLGVANSALVLFSMIVAGLAVDLASLRGSRHKASKLELGRLA